MLKLIVIFLLLSSINSLFAMKTNGYDTIAVCRDIWGICLKEETYSRLQTVSWEGNLHATILDNSLYVVTAGGNLMSSDLVVNNHSQTISLQELLRSLNKWDNNDIEFIIKKFSSINITTVSELKNELHDFNAFNNKITAKGHSSFYYSSLSAIKDKIDSLQASSILSPKEENLVFKRVNPVGDDWRTTRALFAYNGKLIALADRFWEIDPRTGAYRDMGIGTGWNTTRLAAINGDVVFIITNSGRLWKADLKSRAYNQLPDEWSTSKALVAYKEGFLSIHNQIYFIQPDGKYTIMSQMGTGWTTTLRPSVVIDNELHAITESGNYYIADLNNGKLRKMPDSWNSTVSLLAYNKKIPVFNSSDSDLDRSVLYATALYGVPNKDQEIDRLNISTELRQSDRYKKLLDKKESLLNEVNKLLKSKKLADDSLNSHLKSKSERKKQAICNECICGVRKEADLTCARCQKKVYSVVKVKDYNNIGNCPGCVGSILINYEMETQTSPEAKKIQAERKREKMKECVCGTLKTLPAYCTYCKSPCASSSRYRDYDSVGECPGCRRAIDINYETEPEYNRLFHGKKLIDYAIDDYQLRIGAVDKRICTLDENVITFDKLEIDQNSEREIKVTGDSFIKINKLIMGGDSKLTIRYDFDITDGFPDEINIQMKINEIFLEAGEKVSPIIKIWPAMSMDEKYHIPAKTGIEPPQREAGCRGHTGGTGGTGAKGVSVSLDIDMGVSHFPGLGICCKAGDGQTGGQGGKGGRGGGKCHQPLKGKWVDEGKGGSGGKGGTGGEGGDISYIKVEWHSVNGFSEYIGDRIGIHQQTGFGGREGKGGISGEGWCPGYTGDKGEIGNWGKACIPQIINADLKNKKFNNVATSSVVSEDDVANSRKDFTKEIISLMSLIDDIKELRVEADDQVKIELTKKLKKISVYLEKYYSLVRTYKVQRNQNTSEVDFYLDKLSSNYYKAYVYLSDLIEGDISQLKPFLDLITEYSEKNFNIY